MAATTRKREIRDTTSQHTPGAHYGVSIGMTPDGDGQHEVVACPGGRAVADADPFNGDNFALVLRGLSRAKSDAIVLILNSPED